MSTEILKDVSPSQLPSDLRALLERDRALPETATFFPARDRTIADIVGWMVLGGGGAAVFAVTSILFVSYLRSGSISSQTDSDLVTTLGATALVSGLLAIGGLLGVIDDLRRIVAQWTGTADRYGLYLLEQGCLLRVERSSCTFLPRAALLAAEMEEPKPDATGEPHGVIRYREAKSQVATLRLPESLVSGTEAHQRIVDALQRWLAAR